MDQSLWKNIPFIQINTITESSRIGKFANRGGSYNEVDQYINDHDYCVTEEFNSTAINDINALYYGSPEHAYDQKNGLARIYNESSPLLEAIATFFNKYSREGNLKVTELAIGLKENAWKQIPKHLIDIHISLTAVDLNEPNYISEITDTENLDTVVKSLNMFNNSDYDKLVVNQDIIFVTYGFDSLWFNDDYRVMRSRLGDWFRAKYRLYVHEYAPHRDEMIEALRTHKLNPTLNQKDFDAIVIEELFEKVNFKVLPFHNYIELSKPWSENWFSDQVYNVAGGLISFVQVITKYLRKGGVFISGDVAKFNSSQTIQMNTCEFSGLIARYKVEDYLMAQKVLTDLGYNCKILSFNDLADVYLLNGWEEKYCLEEVKHLRDSPNNCFFVVTKE